MISILYLLPSICLLVTAIPGKAVYSCDVSGAHLQLPSNQTQLVIPPSQVPKFIAVGSGVQNYTCSASGTYTSVGALATLFDVSCLAKSPLLTSVPELVYDANGVIPVLTKLLGKTPLKLGQHLFITNPVTNSGVVPRFDFTASQNDPNAFVDATKVGDILAPSDPESNVDWLQLQGFLGDLAKTVFRVNTKGGQPSASCTPGDTASIPYAALYWFFV